MEFLKTLFEKFSRSRAPRRRREGVAEHAPPMPEHIKAMARNGAKIGYDPAFDLNRAILKFGKDKRAEFIFTEEVLEGVLITGNPGSGKTTSSARQLALGVLNNGWGGSILTVKGSDIARFRDYAAQAGRSQDLIEISLDDDRFRFDPIDYEYRREGGGDTANIVELIFDGVEVASRMKSSQTNERFWIDSAKRHCTYGIDCLKLGKRRVKLVELKKLLDSVPQSIEEKQSKEWEQWSFLWECLEDARARQRAGELTLDEAEDFAEAENYFLQKWPSLPDGTRGSIAATLESLLRYLTTGPIRKMMEKTTIIPEMMYERAIFLVALPTQTFGVSGRIYQALFKRSVQDAVLRRDVRLYPRCTFLYIDEAQELVTEYDRKVLGRSRESRLAHIYITQNIPAMIDELNGDAKAQAAVDSLMGNFVIKIGHRTMCKKTRAVYVEAVDKHYMEDVATQTNIGEGNGHKGGINTRQKLEYQLLPAEFGYLRTGGERNNWEVDTILLNGNRTFRNGRNWLKAIFTQEGW